MLDKSLRDDEFSHRERQAANIAAALHIYQAAENLVVSDGGRPAILYEGKCFAPQANKEPTGGSAVPHDEIQTMTLTAEVQQNNSS